MTTAHEALTRELAAVSVTKSYELDPDVISRTAWAIIEAGTAPLDSARDLAEAIRAVPGMPQHVVDQLAADVLTIPYVRNALKERSAARVGAVARISSARQAHPALGRRMADARLDLAAAIIAMDEADNQPDRHNLGEQAIVHERLQAFCQAMADLLRGAES